MRFSNTFFVLLHGEHQYKFSFVDIHINLLQCKAFEPEARILVSGNAKNMLIELTWWFHKTKL